MNNQPLVSLIVPVYNVAPYLRESLDSILNQTYENIEIIVIDDGSKDESGLICDEFAAKDNRIRLIHQTNSGLSSARNVALEIVQGDYIAYIDSDDAVDASFVENMINSIMRDDSDIVVCYFDEQHTESNLLAKSTTNTSPAIKSGTYNHKEILRALFDRKLNTAVFNKLYKRKIWNDLRFPAGHVYEDVEIAYLTFDLCNSITVIDDVLYHQRIRTKSITSTISIKNVKDQMLAQSKIESFVTKNTPDVFPESAIDKLERLHFELLLKSYVRAAAIKGDMINKKDFKKQLRSEILDKRHRFKSKDIKKNLRLVYFSVIYCPWILDIAVTVLVKTRR